jgi:hypothetical protein
VRRGEYVDCVQPLFIFDRARVLSNIYYMFIKKKEETQRTNKSRSAAISRGVC